jgi:hypothetical protein
VAGSCEHGDETSGSGATELVSYIASCSYVSFSLCSNDNSLENIPSDELT